MVFVEAFQHKPRITRNVCLPGCWNRHRYRYISKACVREGWQHYRDYNSKEHTWKLRSSRLRDLDGCVRIPHIPRPGYTWVSSIPGIRCARSRVYRGPQTCCTMAWRPIAWRTNRQSRSSNRFGSKANWVCGKIWGPSPRFILVAPAPQSPRLGGGSPAE